MSRGEEDKDRRKGGKEKKIKMGGERKVVSGTTVKWFKRRHGNSNEGSQDTLGGCRRRGLGKGWGRREIDGKEGGRN